MRGCILRRKRGIKMYSTILILHSILRWEVLIFGFFVFVLSIKGWMGSQPYSKIQKVLGLVYMASFDLQVILGLSLYFGLSPVVQEALKDPKVMMQTRELRFYGVEHIAMMILSMTIMHAGRIMAKRANENSTIQKCIALSTGISFLLIFASIPWPFLGHGRPLLRLF